MAKPRGTHENLSFSVFNAPFLDTDFSDFIDTKLAEPLTLILKS